MKRIRQKDKLTLHYQVAHLGFLSQWVFCEIGYDISEFAYQLQTTFDQGPPTDLNFPVHSYANTSARCCQFDLKVTSGSFCTTEIGVRGRMGDILNVTKEMPNAYFLVINQDSIYLGLLIEGCCKNEMGLCTCEFYIYLFYKFSLYIK